MKIDAKIVPRFNGISEKLFLYRDVLHSKEGDVLGEGFRTGTLELLYCRS